MADKKFVFDFVFRSTNKLAKQNLLKGPVLCFLYLRFLDCYSNELGKLNIWLRFDFQMLNNDFVR